LFIKDLASGKASSTLEVLTDETGVTAANFRWGSNPKRTHSF
jgi:hypothetical protein